MNINKKGFTLIELLVVVLIIGILAAIALPKYKFALEKTKISKYLSIGKSIRNAQRMFYMTNGEYSKSLLALDIDIRHLCESMDSSKHIFYNCIDKSIQIDSYVHPTQSRYSALIIKYCSSLSNTTQNGYRECENNSDLRIYFGYDSGLTDCTAYTEKGSRLCKALGL